MPKLVCKLLGGHLFKVVPSTLNLKRGAPMVVCSRCEFVGYRVQEKR